MKRGIGSEYVPAPSAWVAIGERLFDVDPERLVMIIMPRAERRLFERPSPHEIRAAQNCAECAEWIIRGALADRLGHVVRAHGERSRIAARSESMQDTRGIGTHLPATTSHQGWSAELSERRALKTRALFAYVDATTPRWRAAPPNLVFLGFNLSPGWQPGAYELQFYRRSGGRAGIIFAAINLVASEAGIDTLRPTLK